MDILDKAIQIVQKQVKVYIKKHSLPLHIEYDDLLQEALLRMLRFIHQYDSKKGTLDTFLWLYTNGAITDFLRKSEGYNRYTGKKFFISLSVEVGSDSLGLVNKGKDPENEFMDSIDLPSLLNQIKNVLTPEERMILFLRYGDGKTQAEISELFEVSPSWVSTIHSRAMRKLASALKEAGIVSMNQLVG